MDNLLEFAKGPLFRLSFAIMALGMIRLIYLSIINGLEAKAAASDKKIPMKYIKKLTFGFLLPIRAFRTKPLYSFVSILFHIGLLITPILLFDHALLFENSLSFSWVGITLSKEVADALTILTIVAGFALFLLRSSNNASRKLSRKQDFIWPILIIVPFITGFVCSNATLGPDAYKAFILIHILIAELIFILLPFTKIAHCVLIPFGQWITARSWKFIPQGPEQVTIALGKEGEKL
jgi:nitrate reductase gamma subunit